MDNQQNSEQLFGSRSYVPLYVGAKMTWTEEKKSIKKRTTVTHNEKRLQKNTTRVFHGNRKVGRD